MRSRTVLAEFTLVLLFVLAMLSEGFAQRESVLRSFDNNGKDGSRSNADVVFDNAGNLYGTTSGGGAHYFGTVFELMPKVGGGWTEKSLHDFNCDDSDGCEPLAGVTFDKSGNLYGTTSQGGFHGGGVVFELIPQSSGRWKEKILHEFSGTGGDGYDPYSAGVVLDSAGNVYGTTFNGGSSTDCGTSGCGMIYELTPTAAGGWSEAILYSFGNSGSDGQHPQAGLILDAGGNLYGTTFQGGTGTCQSGSGTTFELSSTGGTWNELVLYDFGATCTDAYGPVARLSFDASGNLYGTTFYGGLEGNGTVFELTPSVSGNWTETLLHSFSNNGTDGYHPYSDLLVSSSGSVYGTTLYGGIYSGIGEYTSGGIAFQLSSAGGGWTETILHSFGSGGDANASQAGLTPWGTSGKLYGTTTGGGAYGDGAVFVIKP